MTSTRPRGRPPRISRRDIAEAVAQIGLGAVTMQSVAQRLGVSAAALYHHVSGREDLLRLACEEMLTEAATDVGNDGHWSIQLRHWAIGIRAMLAANPMLIELNVNGVIGDDRQMPAFGRLVDNLVRQGFTVEAAMAAVETAGAIATGSAIHDIQEAREAAGGRTWPQRVYAMLSRASDGGSTALLALAGKGHSPASDSSFEARLRIALTGIAVVNGFSLDEISP
ncbi:TetR family transcriptional regulator [Mycobacterium sp. TNTM28]|uniref:TetR family transcriptional regulator n=1 Tax=[Mycobacterium] fortunisiensis TaxID=2600579 RepID=A0ABS6KKY3_9MYCO|nr:TetR/AcrR family transcriptional regulator [[Mycobacterium] fortunisiensis]MBU9764221.1 TetR family transcriptional regulator [[Mycobacterium] fortunisiensis]